jgi:hypothetical protein
MDLKYYGKSRRGRYIGLLNKVYKRNNECKSGQVVINLKQAFANLGRYSHINKVGSIIGL